MDTGCFDGIGEAAAQAFFQHKAVNHQINIVLLILLRFDLLCQIIDNAVHTDTGKTLFSGIFEYFQVFTLLTANNGRKNNKASSLTQGFHPIHDLVDGLAGDDLAALGAVRDAHSCPQKAQIVINLGHCSDCGAGILGSGLLVNGNSGRQSVDGIHIGLVHLT